MPSLRNAVFSLAVVSALFGADPGCPAYPQAMRSGWQASRQLDLAFQAHAKSSRARHADAIPHPRDSFIDQYLFDKMAADAVEPAPLATDQEFVRRVYLDLTGRIPSPEQVLTFLDDTKADKRSALISQLLNSPAYVDQFTHYFADKFKVTRANRNVGLMGRNTFHQFIRDFVQSDRPYNQFITQLLTAKGDVDTSPGAQFWARNFADLDGPLQDTWDNTTDVITTQLLGFKTECISCHNGRGYLDKINIWLTRKNRSDFWAMAAYLSRTNFLRWSDDALGYRPKMIVFDRSYGNYSGALTSPSTRPARTNANYDPVWIMSNEPAAGDDFRAELARTLTTDRQFAKATVNFLWAYFFRTGIVDPPDAWDLARVDPDRPPPEGWPMQNTHPELLDQLADHFVAHNYSIKELVRLITSSSVYQLSSRHEGDWKPAYARYFARHSPRRLSPEAIYDSLVIATRTDALLTVFGWNQPVRYANQLPDPTEPAGDPHIGNLLAQFGRGDWLTIPSNNGPTLLGLLFSMNDAFVVSRTLANSNHGGILPSNRVLYIHTRATSDEDAISRMFLATLSRHPTADENAAVMSRRKNRREEWLSDLQWALLNKLDFLFNY
jgi:hypothetical protein